MPDHEPITPASLPWPGGEPKKSAALQTVLPVVRGLHVPPFEPPQAMFSNPPKLPRSRCEEGQLAALATLCGAHWQPWGVTSTEHLNLPSLSAASRADWLQACAQCLSTRHEGDWIVHAGLRLRGLAFMVDMLLTLAPACDDPWLWHRCLHTLRHAVAAASDEDLATAEARAEGLRHASSTCLLAACHLFPHRTDWVDDALAASAPNPHWCSLLNDNPLTLAQAQKLIGLAPRYRPNLTLLVHMHGTALLPVLSALLERAQSHEVVTYLDVLLALPCPAQIPTLMAHFERHPQVRTRLDRLGERYPAATLYTAIEQTLRTHSRLLQGWTLRLGSHHTDALAQALSALSPDAAAQWRQLVHALQQPEAPDAALPMLLRSPPWLSAAKPAPLPTLDMPALPIEPQFALPEVYSPHDDWFKRSLLRQARHTGSLELAVLAHLNVHPEVRQAILDGRAIEPADVSAPIDHWGTIHYMLHLPDALALRVWNEYPASHWSTHDDQSALVTLLARLGPPALPGLRRYAVAQPERGLAIGALIDDAALADLALLGQRRSKQWRTLSLAWMQRHPRSTALRALHHAFGSDAPLREAGATALRWLLHDGGEAHAALIDAIAAEYGGAMPAAWQALQAQDPLAMLPARLPRLPSFFTPATFARPLLNNGQGALPLDAVNHLGTMLAISRPEAPYAGLEIVRAACTADSLAEFAWDLFAAWEAAGAPSAHNWVFQALRWLGSDETVRRLAPKVRAWPSESATRALAGLDILAAIGSDLALMQVSAIAGKSRFKKLRDHAREKIAAIAEARELTPDELADRLVPELGLDERGAELLDFGPRQFRVVFDESLGPQVRDANGQRLKTLPRPNKADNAELAHAANARFKQLKKDAAAIANVQITRLEHAMTRQRRWSATDFERFFVQHPVMRFLAARLIWGVYAGPAPHDALVAAFRLAEDWTLADMHDGPYALPATATVGIAHVLDLPPATLAACAQILADYMVLQPFAQIGRSTEALTDAERQANVVSRFADRPVRTGSILGLVQRGWEYGPVYGGGLLTHFTKPVPGSAHLIVAQIDPSLVLGTLRNESGRSVTHLSLHASADGPALPLSGLGPVAASEMLRDIELMAPYTGA